MQIFGRTRDDRYYVLPRSFSTGIPCNFLGRFFRTIRSFVYARFDESMASVRSWREKETASRVRTVRSSVISVCIMSRTVLLRGKIPRNNARHACKYGRAPQMGHSNVSRYYFYQRWPGLSTDHVVNPTLYISLSLFLLRKAFVSLDDLLLLRVSSIIIFYSSLYPISSFNLSLWCYSCRLDANTYHLIEVLTRVT